MLILIAFQFATLLVASLLLLIEVRAGHVSEPPQKFSLARAAVYLLAAVAGATLLVSMDDGEWLFALALVPITFLSLLRFGMVARFWWSGWRLPVYTCALLAIGMVSMLPMMPFPLNRTFVLDELHLIDTSVGRPDTINPEAVRTVRA